MNSASNDNLRDKLRHDQVESEAQQQRELRRLARIFLARVYDPANLALLLGPLFMCQLPQEQTSAMRPSSTATSHSASPMRLGASSSATAVDDVRHEGAQAQTSGEEGPQVVIDVERLPMTVKTKILGVVEMICAILSAPCSSRAMHRTHPPSIPHRLQTRSRSVARGSSTLAPSKVPLLPTSSSAGSTWSQRSSPREPFLLAAAG